MFLCLYYKQVTQHTSRLTLALESNTLALVFDTSTGTLTSYQDTSNADATNTLNAFKNSSATILSTLESLQTYELERERLFWKQNRGSKTRDK